MCPSTFPICASKTARRKAHVRIGWLRSVANIYHAFAVQSFADELAHAAGRDPVDYMLDLIGPARIVDVKASAPENNNYGGSTTEYPLDTARMRRVVNWPRKNPAGANESWVRAAGWVSLCIGVS